MTEQISRERQQAIREKLEYQRAIYRVHECDDPALREHFQDIINAYEHKHMKKEDPRQMHLALEFNGRGLA